MTTERKYALIFVSMPYSDPSRRVVSHRMAIFCRKMAEYVLRGECVTSILWFHYALVHAPALSADWDAWKTYAHALIPQCSKLRVLRLHGWNTSTGVKDEIAIAEAHGIPVEYDDA